jgi:acyl-CoA thioester hydrolase
MANTFTLKKRIEFAETDMAGIVHFSNFFRYMEMIEHAFLRSLGFSVHCEFNGERYGWPRVHADCDYKMPLRFEDIVEIQLFVQAIGSRKIKYLHIFRKLDDDPSNIVAIGHMIAVCVTSDGESNAIQSANIPEELVQNIDVAPVSCYGEFI